MTTNEPMSEQALTMIRELLADDGRQWGDYSPQELYRVGWAAELLLAEVDRLRACEQALAAADEDADETLVQAVQEMKRLKDENTRLRAENDAMRPMVEAVANTHSRLHCALGCRVNDRWNTEFHAPDCLITQARAFVAAHPDTAAGEAESEA